MRELVHSTGLSSLGSLLELFIWHRVLLAWRSLDFEQGRPRKQLHIQLLSGVGSSPPAALKASSELTANSWVISNHSKLSLGLLHDVLLLLRRSFPSCSAVPVFEAENDSESSLLVDVDPQPTPSSVEMPRVYLELQWKIDKRN